MTLEPVHLGDLEQLVLIALVRLGKEAYGVPVRDEIAARTGRDPDLGTVYSALTRLEEKGLIGSRLGDPTPERGGRRKKHFDLTPAGKVALANTIRGLRSMTAGLGARFELS
jgi:PadR family transcriptional regulator PadR